MGKHGKIQSAVEYAAAYSVLKGLGMLPYSVALAAGRGMGRITFAFSDRLRWTGMRNLEIAFPRMSVAERKKILRGCFTNLGRLLGVFSQLQSVARDGLHEFVDYEGTEHLEAARAKGHGVFLYTGHIGAWELCSFVASAFGHPLEFLSRRIDNPKVEELIEATRTRFGNQSIDKRAAARPMLKTLSAGGTIGILIDLNTQPHEGVFVEFFGIPASTTSSMATLALRTGAAVLPMTSIWHEELKRFVVKIHPPVEIEPTGDRDEDVVALTARATEVLEGIIRRYPDQWLWIHKRWNTRPNGEPELYSREPHMTSPRKGGQDVLGEAHPNSKTL